MTVCHFVQLKVNINISDKPNILRDSLFFYNPRNCSHTLTAPIAQLSCVIYNLAINLPELQVTFMALFPRERGNKASELSHHRDTLSDFDSAGGTRKQKLYMLISTNAYFHTFYSERSAAELSHCQFTRMLILSTAHSTWAYFCRQPRRDCLLGEVCWE